MKHARQVLIEDWDQDRVRETRVAVVGNGALGSNVGDKLARLGVGEILLIDLDTLEEHNLENQVFDRTDLGKAKARALADRIHRVDPSLDVRAWVGDVADYAGDWDVDIVFGCFDNVQARYQLNAIALDHGLPLIDGGINRYRGTVMTILPGETACYGCQRMLPVKPPASCDEDPIPTTYVTANATSSLQVMQLIKLVHDQTVHSHLYLDLDHGVLHTGDLEPNPDCAYCGGL